MSVHEELELPEPRSAARWLQLLGGLFGIGLAIPLMIRSGLGLGPWDALHVGIHLLTGISVGAASILVGLIIVIASYGFGVRAGPGTIANMVLIGLFIDLLLPLFPDPPGWRTSLGYYTTGLILAGLSTGMYMSAGLGNGPRDGLMMGLSQWGGWPVRRVRTVIELSALVGGWAMGGTIGVGTVLFAVTIGPLIQMGLRLFGALPAYPVERASAIPLRPRARRLRARRAGLPPVRPPPPDR